eukprot:5904818-Prymnesium_polylepis.1
MAAALAAWPPGKVRRNGVTRVRRTAERSARSAQPSAQAERPCRVRSSETEFADRDAQSAER